MGRYLSVRGFKFFCACALSGAFASSAWAQLGTTRPSTGATTQRSGTVIITPPANGAAGGAAASGTGAAGGAGTGAAAGGAAAPGTISLVTSGLNERGMVRLPLNKSAVLTTSRPYTRISVGQAEIAEINGIGRTRVLITGKKPGSTQLILWDEQDNSQMIDVIVEADLMAMRELYPMLFPDAKIEIVGNEGAVALTGHVPNLQTAEQAAMIASCYSNKVMNLLEVGGGQQVMLQVRFAEVSRAATSNLGVNLGFSDGRSFGANTVGQVGGLAIEGFGADNVADLAMSSSSNPSVTLFGRGLIGNTAIAGFLSALRQNNLLRILAEPNLIATSGQEASFLAGGEFPVPVPQSGTADSTTITIQFKEFGVRLSFLPVVLGNGRIRMRVSPEVSDLDFTTAVRFGGFVVPGLQTRRVSTTVELAEGQTFALAGLLNNNVTATKDVTPLIGDVPVIGALFRSVRYQHRETELVVLVTPRLTEAMNPGQVPPLPGESWKHPNEGELFLNQDLGGPKGAKGEKSMPDKDETPRAFIGNYGYVPAEASK
jgi:pilus assembly protein CpaC